MPPGGPTPPAEPAGTSRNSGEPLTGPGRPGAARDGARRPPGAPRPAPSRPRHLEHGGGTHGSGTRGPRTPDASAGARPRADRGRTPEGGPRARTSGADPVRTPGRGAKDPSLGDHRRGSGTCASGTLVVDGRPASVTGVTELVFRRGEFTPSLQLANLICAIAPARQPLRARLRPAPPRRRAPSARTSHGRARSLPSPSGDLPRRTEQAPPRNSEPVIPPPSPAVPPRRPVRDGRVRALPRDRRDGAEGGPRTPWPPTHRPVAQGSTGRPGAQKRSHRTRRSPVRSMTTCPNHTGMTPVGAGVRRLRLWVGGCGWGTVSSPGL